MTIRAWQLLGVAAAVLSLGGCHRATPHADGSGYGAGLARRPLIIGHGLKGSSAEGVFAPTEYDIGRIKAPPPESWPQAGRID